MHDMLVLQRRSAILKKKKKWYFFLENGVVWWGGVGWGIKDMKRKSAFQQSVIVFSCGGFFLFSFPTVLGPSEAFSLVKRKKWIWKFDSTFIFSNTRRRIQKKESTESSSPPPTIIKPRNSKKKRTSAWNQKGEERGSLTEIMNRKVTSNQFDFKSDYVSTFGRFFSPPPIPPPSTLKMSKLRGKIVLKAWTVLETHFAGVFIKRASVDPESAHSYSSPYANRYLLARVRERERERREAGITTRETGRRTHTNASTAGLKRERC